MGKLSPAFLFFQAEDGIRDLTVTGVQTCALPISNGPGRARGHGAGSCRGLVADSRTSVGIDGDIDGELAEKFSIGIEDLDAAVATIGDVDVVVRIDSDAVRGVEVARLVAGFAPRLEPVALFVDFGDTRIDIAVADVGVARGVPRDVGDLTEHAVDRRKRRLDVLERLGTFVGGFLLSARNQDDAALGVGIYGHVRALVRPPNGCPPYLP